MTSYDRLLFEPPLFLLIRNTLLVVAWISKGWVGTTGPQGVLADGGCHRDRQGMTVAWISKGWVGMTGPQGVLADGGCHRDR